MIDLPEPLLRLPIENGHHEPLISASEGERMGIGREKLGVDIAACERLARAQIEVETRPRLVDGDRDLPSIRTDGYVETRVAVNERRAGDNGSGRAPGSHLDQPSVVIFLTELADIERGLRICDRSSHGRCDEQDTGSDSQGCNGG